MVPPATSPLILFYSPASPSIGYGHLSRCLNLADAVRAHGFGSSFMVQDEDSIPARWIRSRKHGVEVLDSSDPSTTLSKYGKEPAKWVVVDSYEASAEFLTGLAGIKRLAVIEDHVDRDLRSASLVVCLAPGSRRSYLKVRSDAVVLTGTSYALVGESFARRRSESLATRQFGPKATRVGIAMGATDTKSFIEPLLSVLADRPSLDIRVAGSISRPEAVVHPANVEWLGFISNDRMARLMIWSDLFIASASTLTWELATLGAPACFVVTAPNQERIGQFLDDLNIPVAATPEELGELINPLLDDAGERRSLARRLSAVCDGSGSTRVAGWLTR